MSRIPRREWLAALALAATAFALASFVNARTSATWDEPAYLASGISYLATRDYRLKRDAPPLCASLGAAATIGLGSKLPLDDPSWERADEWTFAKVFLNERNRPIARALVFRARLPIAALSALSVLVVFAWARSLAGPRAGVAAAALLAFEPSWLAHSAILSCDVAVSAFMAASTFVAARAAAKGDLSLRASLALSGLVFLALASKFTGTALGLVLALTVLPVSRERFLYLARAALVVLALVAVLLYPGEVGLGWYLGGLSTIYKNLDPDLRYYLLGSYAKRGWPQYALVCLALKGTLGFLALALWGSAKALRARGPLLAPAILAATVLATSLADPAAFGLRRILPALPPLCVLGGVACARAGKARLLAAVLLAAHVASSLRAAPSLLAYVNEAAGGPPNARRLFCDSNVDWGQALPDLERAIAARRPRAVKLRYFGTVDPALYGVDAEPLALEDLLHPEEGVLYAISETRLVELHGQRLAGEIPAATDWFDREPVARAGEAIYLYESR